MGPADPSAKILVRTLWCPLAYFIHGLNILHWSWGHVTAVQKCSLSGLVFWSTCTFPFDQPVISSGTPSESRSKLWMEIAWFLDCKRKKPFTIIITVNYSQKTYHFSNCYLNITLHADYSYFCCCSQKSEIGGDYTQGTPANSCIHHHHHLMTLPCWWCSFLKK